VNNKQSSVFISAIVCVLTGCGASFLDDAIYGRELIENRETLSAAIIIEEYDSYLEARLYEREVGENADGDPMIELFVDVGFDGHISALDQDIEELRAEGIEVDETLDENSETLLRASFNAEGRSVNVRGRLQKERSILQLDVMVDNLQLGTVYLEKRMSSRLSPIDAENIEDDDDSAVAR
jgi:hypothetical protein